MLRESKAVLFGIMICFIFSLNLSGDSTGPRIRWADPTENACFNINSSNPNIIASINSRDESGVKQGVIWLRKGLHTTKTDLRSWTKVWSRTFATPISAPPSTSSRFKVRMMGRGEGAFTMMAEFKDIARPNTSISFVHFFTDTSPPTVRITSPADNSVICKDKNLMVNIAASDSGCGIREVVLYFGMVSRVTIIGRDSTSPYEIRVPKARFTNSTHRLIAIAYDKAGRSNRASIVIKPQRICLNMRIVR